MSTSTPEYGFPLPQNTATIAQFPWHLRNLSTTLEDKLPGAIQSTAETLVPAAVDQYAEELTKRADEAREEAIAYTDTKVAGLATTAAVQAGDQKALAEAKAYTDVQLSEIGAGGGAVTLTGPGRPDVPSTTAGTITGDEPVGAEYRSTDGAQVGAFVWMKRPGNVWAVTNGDTGWRNVSDLLTSPWTTSTIPLLRIRRVGDVAFLHVQYNVKPVPSGAIFVMPVGFRGKGGGVNAGIASAQIIGQYNNSPIGSGVTSYQNVNGSNTVLTNGASEGGASALTWSAGDPWPTAPLPGSPA